MDKRKKAYQLKEEVCKIVDEMKMLREKWREIMKRWVDQIQDIGNIEEEMMENATSKFYSNFYIKFHNFIINVFLCR